VSDPHLPEHDSPPDQPPAWTFRITLVLVAVYLIYRFGQLIWSGIEWIGRQL
jgi:hypothetical protein